MPTQNEPDPATRPPDSDQERPVDPPATLDDERQHDERQHDEYIAAREAALDAALDMTFPASDPPSFMP